MATMLEPTKFVDISDEMVEAYGRDGAICVRGAVAPYWIDKLREATERVLASHTNHMNRKGDTGRFVGDLDVWLRDEDFRDFAVNGPSWAIAQRLMRASMVTLFADQLFVKEPGTSAPSPWHQDQTYWPIVGSQICSVWVAMDPVSKETSGLEYVRGSHLWNRRFKPQTFGESDLSWLAAPGDEDVPDIDADRSRYEFLSWDMQPGDVLVHDSMMVHGAGGNRSQLVRRRAVTTRWCGEDAYFRPSFNYTPEMVGLAPGEPVSHARELFPPVPLPKGRALPRDYWADWAKDL